MLIGEKKKIVALTVFLFIFLKITSSILDAQIKKLGWDQLTSISIARITSKSSTLKAAFSYTPIFPVSGLPIQFYDKSSGNPDKWSWDFGDGSFSSEKNPTHIYNTSGYFIVSLTVEFNGTTSKISRKIRVLAGANKTSSEQKVGELTANFVFQPAVTEEGMEVQFTDMSTGNPTSWNWNFGDGGTSSEKNPKHIYTKSGTYNITLEVSNGAVTKNTVKQITVVSSLIPDFSYSPDQPEVGQSVQFVDVTVGNPVNWAWDFGDGDSSTLRNPIHVYNQPGLYKVTLKVSNSYFTKFVSKTISIKSLPVVDFDFSPSLPQVGQEIQFYNLTTCPVESYSWSFGDGATSSLKDPVHRYQAPGSYVVTLTATNDSGSASKSKTIVIAQSLFPGFSYSPSSPYAGENVQFTDTSQGNPTSWQWDFGDGFSATMQNPSHVYEEPGSFNVTLRISNGAETKSLSQTITIKTRVRADFSFSPTLPLPGTSVVFTDKSSGNIKSWNWNFGDGATSTEQNPTHIYNTSGSYNVTLTVSDGTYSNSMIQTVQVKALLSAKFSFEPSNPVVGQQVQFFDNSEGTPVNWQWDFGDGTVGSVKNPTHVYAKDGTYTVQLTVSDGTNTSSFTQAITILPATSGVIRAASCQLGDVEAAIAMAKAGDVVVVPNGSAVWNRQLVVTKGVILKAESKGGVSITSNYSGVKYQPSNFLIYYKVSNPEADEPFRISGFKIDLAGKCEGILIENSTVVPSRRNRIDNNEIRNAAGRLIKIVGTVYGVADNNVLDLSGGALLTVYGLNEASWKNLRYELGTGDTWFFEDNVVYVYDTAHDGGVGGRYCARYNHYINRKNGNIYPLFDMHGNMGSGDNLSGMGIEVYGNTIDLAGYNSCLYDQRGGRGVFFNNVVVNGGSVDFKVREEYFDYLNPPEAAADGQPQHVSDSYFWGNVRNGVKMTVNNPYVGGTLDYGGSKGVVPREDVHFWREKGVFDGSSGVGVGLLAARPEQCTREGVGWWATDKQTLYRWKNNSWQVFYIPYTYPHPLRYQLAD